MADCSSSSGIKLGHSLHPFNPSPHPFISIFHLLNTLHPFRFQSTKAGELHLCIPKPLENAGPILSEVSNKGKILFYLQYLFIIINHIYFTEYSGIFTPYNQDRGIIMWYICRICIEM